MMSPFRLLPLTSLLERIIALVAPVQLSNRCKTINGERSFWTKCQTIRASDVATTLPYPGGVGLKTWTEAATKEPGQPARGAYHRASRWMHPAIPTRLATSRSMTSVDPEPSSAARWPVSPIIQWPHWAIFNWPD